MKMRNESGRSMVEMLGVLAIIGVLSVGGISGYTMAMNRYRANEVIDMANKFAATVYASRETYKVMHNGSVDGWNQPTLTGLGLFTGSNSTVNGTTITATDVTDTGATIQMEFGENTRVCNAVASTLGVSATGCPTLSYTFSQS